MHACMHIHPCSSLWIHLATAHSYAAENLQVLKRKQNSSRESELNAEGGSDGFECPVCSRVFKRSRLCFVRHLDKHKSEFGGYNVDWRHVLENATYRFSCDKCGKRFRTLQNLRKHQTNLGHHPKPQQGKVVAIPVNHSR